MFQKLLIANRGEIALRIQRACRELGVKTVAVYSEADISAKYVRLADEAICIGPAAVDKSYLNKAAIIAAAEVTDAEAIHPGYGLLSENAEFAEQVEKSGFVFVGPRPETIRLMGNKLEAKRAVAKVLPCIPGGTDPIPEDLEEIKKRASAIGYPLILKAAAGGGGRGMRLIRTEPALLNAIDVLRAEVLSAFGDDTIYAEKALEECRHVEVQVLADNHKNVVHLGTRDCSLQRRYQKIVEEAPAPNLPKRAWEQICERSVDACRKIGYSGAGTMEFLYSGNKFYFIEMNTRVQVEHPVTEMITGIDIVAEQIRIAAGAKLSFRQKDISFSGHSIQCRINAEDPITAMPSPGTVARYHPAGGPGVRVDSHVYQGYEIPPFYDSLLGKLLVHGSSREQAILRMRSALKEFVVSGVTTNLDLHRELLADETFVRGGVCNDYLEKKLDLMRRSDETSKRSLPSTA